MNKKDFLKQYQSEWWIETSRRVKARDHNTCQMCGCNDKPLSVHHLYYGEDGSIHVPDSSLITLCEDCHLEQEDYKELCQQSLKELRQELTDFEIYNILEAVKMDNTSMTSYPIYMRNVNPKITPRRYMLDEDVQKLKNLSKWRNGILKKNLVHNAIYEYFISVKCHYYREDEIEKWFQNNYGVSLIEYISDHKEIADKIEKEAQQIIDKTKEKYGNKTI